MSNDNTNSVDEAISNLNAIKDGQDPRASNEPETTNTPQTTPFTRPSINAGRHTYEERRVRDYLMDWYEGTPSEFDIDWSDVTIIVSASLTRAHGKARYKAAEESYELKISKCAIDNDSSPWDDEIQETIRHEAIHIWQYQEFGEGNHGPSFKRWADQFDCEVRASRPAKDPKYTINCENCGKVGTRQQACKITKQTARYSCGTCGGNLSVQRNR